jgi:TM2 domain-containing membrane protein YozV
MNTQINANGKSMAVSLILSLFFPGLGMIYTGLVKRGIVILIISFIIAYASSPLYVIFWVLVLVDTYLTLNSMKNGEVPKVLGIFDLPDGW